MIFLNKKNYRELVTYDEIYFKFTDIDGFYFYGHKMHKNDYYQFHGYRNSSVDKEFYWDKELLK